ncbi:hypothetical protein GCM10023080_065980 [Streptomyces pseudoechinosporeus]
MPPGLDAEFESVQALRAAREVRVVAMVSNTRASLLVRRMIGSFGHGRVRPDAAVSTGGNVYARVKRLRGVPA